MQTPLGDDSDATLLSAASLSDVLPSLNEFVATHVSEDDRAYAQLAEKDHRQFRERSAWLEESAVKARLQLEASADASRRPNALPFEVRNALMWYPHAIDDTAQLKAQGDPANSISKTNTRFAVPAPIKKKRRVGGADESNAAAVAGVSTRDEADKFGYVQSPALQPGIDVAPIMTWGKIGSTPQRVRDGDHSDDDDNDDDDDDAEDERMLLATFGSDKGPIGQFKVAATPDREAVALNLASAVHERRVRASRAQQQASRARPTADPRRNVQLSPAGARLAQSMSSGGTGLGMRRDFTPVSTSSLSSFGAELRRSYSRAGSRANSVTNTPRQ